MHQPTPTHEEITAAYEELGLKPTSGTWSVERREDGQYCCPLTAVMLARGLTSLEEDYEQHALRCYRLWGDHWVDGFIAGVDDAPRLDDLLSIHPEWRHGWERGLLVAAWYGLPDRA